MKERTGETPLLPGCAPFPPGVDYDVEAISWGPWETPSTLRWGEALVSPVWFLQTLSCPWGSTIEETSIVLTIPFLAAPHVFLPDRVTVHVRPYLLVLALLPLPQKWVRAVALSCLSATCKQTKQGLVPSSSSSWLEGRVHFSLKPKLFSSFQLSC